MTDAVSAILDHDRGQPPGVIANLARILNAGTPGTGGRSQRGGLYAVSGLGALQGNVRGVPGHGSQPLPIVCGT